MLAALLLPLSLPSDTRAIVVLHDLESFQVDAGEVQTDSVLVSAESVRIGMPVQVVFENHDDVWFPLFEPVRE